MKKGLSRMGRTREKMRKERANVFFRMHVGDTESLCSQVRTWETRNVKHAGLSLKERGIHLFPTQKAGMDVANSLAASALSVRPDHTWFPQIPVSISATLPRPFS